MTQYLIIGNGVAGTTAAEHIRNNDSDGDITIVTDEDLPFYWRVRLNDFIAGEISSEELVAKDEDWYHSRNIRLILNTRITDGDPDQRVVTDPGENRFSYDRLLLATGSHSFVPPIEGAGKKGVFTLRSVADARHIAEWAHQVEEVILIGGGLLGLEAGNGLLKLGKKVMVVEFFPRLLPRQLDTDGARRLQGMMEQMGFRFRLGAKTQSIAGDDTVTGIVLDGGEVLSGEMVLISAGVRPNLDLVEPLGLEHDKGVQVDEHLRTNRPDIYAAGDVAEFRGMPYGIWPAAMEQGKFAGLNMTGIDASYEGTTMSTKLKVVGIDLASAGNIDAENELESRVVEGEGQYKKIVLQDDRIVGCIMLGDTRGFNEVTRAMTHKKDVAPLKNQLLTENFDWARL